MRPFETLDSVTIPDGRELTLHRRDRDFAIYLDGDELMATRAPGSEMALATIALEYRSSTSAPQVLIGGLGLGYTLRSALEVLPAGGRVVVAEVFDSVVIWGRTHLAGLHGSSLDDPRVRVVAQDVHAVIGEGSPRWDAILLDVDNGPDAWCLETNRRLYDRRGLSRIQSSLRSGGVLAIWSAHHDAAFVKRLGMTGFDVETKTVRAHGRKGSRHTIFLARAPGRP